MLLSSRGKSLQAVFAIAFVLSLAQQGVAWHSSGSSSSTPTTYNCPLEGMRTTSTGNLNDGSSLYGNNADCEWNIRPGGAGAPFAGPLTLTFTYFSTESNYDFVEVCDGASCTGINQIFRSSGDLAPFSLTATTGQMTVRFTSDGSVQGGGFSADWQVFLNTTASSAVCGNSTSATVLRTGFGTISDGPSDYSNGMDCTISIEPDIGGNALLLSFSEFDLEPCCDELYVYDGSVLIAVYTGNTLPEDIYAVSGAMTIVFSSDSTVVGGGFLADFSTVFAYDVPVAWDGTPICSGDQTLTATSGEITDGSRSSHYPTDHTCRWVIELGAALELSFSRFHLASNAHVRVYDESETLSNRIADLTLRDGEGLPAPLVASSGTMIVVFTTGSTNTLPGFTAAYALAPARFCTGGVLTAAASQITDGSGPHNYDHNVNCVWTINPDGPIKDITITFTEFDVEVGFDGVWVYDGALGTNLLGIGDGSAFGPLTAYSGLMTIQFATDSSVSRQGFTATYTSVRGVNCSDCDVGATCFGPDAEGDFLCACNAGYNEGAMGGIIGECDDINECAEQTDTCGKFATCTNTEGSFACTCLPGYRDVIYRPGTLEPLTNEDILRGETGIPSNGTACVDFDHCELETDRCDVEAACINGANGTNYTCACRDGYFGSGFEGGCADIDECDLGNEAGQYHNCHAEATCTNAIGAPFFSCECNIGFRGGGVTCSDIDECALDKDNCDGELGTCTNTEGSFVCSCTSGYELGPGFPDDTTCFDIDECSAGVHNCDVDATCTNEPGTFTCSCNSGWVGDGLECRELCSESEASECHEMAFCEDATCTCPEGMFGSGYGVDGCIGNAFSVRFTIALAPGSFEVVNGNKLASWAQDQPAYIALLTDTPPAGFATSMFHEVNGNFLTIAALFESELDASTARDKLTAALRANERRSLPTVFGTTLDPSTYETDPRVYAWVSATTSAGHQILPTGLQLDAVSFQPSCKQSGCWVIDVTYTLGANNFNVMYLPKAIGSDDLSFDFDYNVPMSSYAITAEETFLPANFPCRTFDYVPGSDPSGNPPPEVTSCCIPQFLAAYRPITSFVTEMEAAGVDQATCDSGDVPLFARPEWVNADPNVTYVSKPVDAIAGLFAGLNHSEVRFTGVLDPYVRQYTAKIYLDEVELRRNAGKLRGTVGVEHTVDTFIGLANFKPTGIEFLDPFATQVNIHLEKTSFFSVSTHGTNDYTFLEYVNLRLVAVYNEDADFSGVSESSDRTVRTDKSNAAHYVQVTFTLGSQYGVDADSDLIPLDSVRVGDGSFLTDPSTVMEHKCMQYRALDGHAFADVAAFNATLDQPCAPRAAMCASPQSIPDSFVSFNIPLGVDYLAEAQADLSYSVFVSLVVSAIDSEARAAQTSPNSGEDPWQVKTTLTASIPYVTGGVNIFCDGFTAKTDLLDVSNVDVIVGSAADSSELSRLRILKDIASTQLDPQQSLATVDSASIEAGLLTLVITGNESYFGPANSGLAGLSVELEDVVTIHVMDVDGSGEDASVVAAVEALLAAPPADNSDASGLITDGYALNGAFEFWIDRGAHRAHLEPLPSLMALCPYNPSPPSASDSELATCITRRDVRFRGYPARAGSASTAMEICANLGGPGGNQGVNDAGCQGASCCGGAMESEQDFFVSILGDNSYARDLSTKFASVVADEYQLNQRYRRAFWINPGYEWVPTQTGGASLFSVSQKTFLLALVTLDEGVSEEAGQMLDPAGPSFSLRRRMLLQASSGVGDSLQNAQSSVSGAAVEFETSHRQAMASAFQVPLDRVATFVVRFSLSAPDACLEPRALQGSLRTALEAFAREHGAISDFHSLQVTHLRVDKGQVECDTQRRSLLASGATAEVTMLVVFKEGTRSQIDLAMISEQMDDVLHIETLVASPKVDAAPLDIVDLPSRHPASGPANPESQDADSTSNVMIMAAVAGSIGAVLVVVGGGFFLWRSRADKVPTAPQAAVARSELALTKAELAQELT